MNTRNYFEILNLSIDPLECNVNQALARLKQCIDEWKSAPQDDVLRKTWLESAPDMEKALSDPQQLVQMANKALEKEKKRIRNFLKSAAIDNQIPQSIFRNICNNSELGMDSISHLADEEGLVISRQPITKTCPQLKVPEKPEKSHPVHLISASRDIQKLKTCLEAAGKKSIYDYLNCSSKLSCEQLLKINSDKSNEPNKGGSANNPVNTIKVEITTVGAKYFKNEDSKRRYDYAWRGQEICNRVLSAFPNYVEGSPGTIAPIYYYKLYEALLAEAMEPADAQWLVYRRCCQGKDKVPFPWEEQFVVCPKCQTQNESGNSRCTKCGEIFRLNCPKCGKLINSSNPKCHCGTRFDTARKVYESLEEASKALNGGSDALNKAIDDIQGILRTFPDYVPAKALMSELQKAKVAVLLDSLEAPCISNIQAVGNNLQITWVKARLQGKELDRLPDEQATPITYTLRRKIGGIPSSMNDGETMGGSMQNPYIDKQVKPGVEYGYAVFAVVNKRVLPGRAGYMEMLLPEADFYASMGDGKAELSWCELPAGWSVSLVRKEGGTPSSAGDGIVLPVKSGSSYTDTGLTNGTQYGYLLVLTRGKHNVTASCTGTPQKPPPALQPEQWSYERNGNDLLITWELPAGADEVRWIVADKMPAAPKSVLPASRFETAGETDKETGRTILRNINPCGKFIIPLVVKGDAALVCESIHGGLQKLRLRREIEQISLEWEWPAGCNEVMVMYGNKTFANSPDDAGTNELRTCTRHGEETHHKLRLLNMNSESDFYFSVFMRCGNNWSAPRKIYSPGAKSHHMIECRVVKRGNGWVFEARNKQGSIPAMEVRGARNILPLSRQDGKLACNVDASRQPVVSIPIPETMATSGFCFMPFVVGAATHTLHLNRKSLTIE